MIVWCEICKEVPLDTACNERLVCMPCGVRQDFDSWFDRKEKEESLTEKIRRTRERRPPTPVEEYINRCSLDCQCRWNLAGQVSWNTEPTVWLELVHVDPDEYIIRSEN